jgi:hypothetical protein
MSKIYKTTDDFPFQQLNIGKPVSAPGGNFFIRYSIDETPLYIQPPKCLVKQVLNKTGKRMYCDFVFHQENEQFIRWMENLENKSQQLIFKNKSQWFESDLEIQDIENSFTSPLKIYKSGKSYIVRTNIQTRNGKPIVKIYDEDEKEVLLDQIKENMNVMVILEIQGIRCSLRSFQIEIELKQMMVLKPDDLFDTCILKSRKDTKTDDLGNTSELQLPVLTQPSEPQPQQQPQPSPTVDLFEPIPVIPHTNIVSQIPQMDKMNTIATDTSEEPNVSTENYLPSHASLSEPSQPSESAGVSASASESFGSSGPTVDSDSIELREVDFDLEEMSETDTISIKQRKDVYYEMYREALQKAKVAKDLALSAYLEAKHIKNKYMLDDISDEEDFEQESGEESEEDENQESEEAQESH